MRNRQIPDLGGEVKEVIHRYSKESAPGWNQIKDQTNISCGNRVFDKRKYTMLKLYLVGTKLSSGNLYNTWGSKFKTSGVGAAQAMKQWLFKELQRDSTEQDPGAGILSMMTDQVGEILTSARRRTLGYLETLGMITERFVCFQILFVFDVC